MCDKNEATTFIETKWEKSKQAEPIEAKRQVITLFISLYPTIKALEAISNARSPPKATMITHLTIVKSEMPAS